MKDSNMLYGIDPEFVPHYRLLTHPNYLFAQVSHVSGLILLPR